LAEHRTKVCVIVDVEFQEIWDELLLPADVISAWAYTYYQHMHAYEYVYDDSVSMEAQKRVYRIIISHNVQGIMRRCGRVLVL